MDREAPGESFSSPSVNPTVTAIKRGAGERAEITLSDGSSFFVYPEVPEQIGIAEGVALDGGLWEALQQCHERYMCREKAVELLARREHSSAELHRKLRERSFSAGTIREVLQELRERSWLDDERFARLYAETRLRRKPMGASKLSEELQRKGVPRAITERTVEEFCTDEYQREAVERAAEKARRRVGDEREKLLRSLLNRGFAMEYIRKCTVYRELEGKK
jgi:regulatory protein